MLDNCIYFYEGETNKKIGVKVLIPGTIDVNSPDLISVKGRAEITESNSEGWSTVKLLFDKTSDKTYIFGRKYIEPKNCNIVYSKKSFDNVYFCLVELPNQGECSVKKVADDDFTEILLNFKNGNVQQDTEVSNKKSFKKLSFIERKHQLFIDE